MDLTRCLLISLAITVCLGVFSCFVLYFLYNFSHKGEPDKFNKMEQKSFKVTFSAKARLYTGYNFTGDWDEYYFTENDPVKCFNLQKPHFIGKIQSVDTFGTCIRLYAHHCCKGQSMAYYPKKNLASANGPEFDVAGVRSVSPCFSDELEKALTDREKLEKTKTGPLQNSQAGKTFKNSKLTTLNPLKSKFKGGHGQSLVNSVPDHLCVGMHCGYVMRTRQLPIKYYRVGYGGRVEFIWAEIHRDYISHSEISYLEGENDNYKDKDGDWAGSRVGSRTTLGNDEMEKEKEEPEGDQMGHFIGARLGPQANLPFENIFPQSPTNARLLKEEEDKVLEMIKSDKEVWVGINIVYETEDSTRPIGFVYRIQQPHDYGDIIVSQNYLPNLI